MHCLIPATFDAFKRAASSLYSTQRFFTTLTIIDQNAMYKAISLFALLFVFVPQVVAQQTWGETSKFVYASGESTDGLGEGVAVHDGVALLGAPAVGRANFSAGYVVVVNLENEEWVFSQELVADDGQLDDQFGFSVALHGDLAVVGAPQADDGSGAAYVFEKENGVWSQILSMAPEGEVENAEFGRSVAVYEDMVFVGAPDQDVNGDPTGAAYIYQITNSQIVDEQKITYGDFSFISEFGASVALRSDLLVVGIPNRGLGAQNFGSVALFVQENGDWVFSEELQAGDAEPQDVLGTSVSIEGEWIIAGALGEDQEGTGAGATYVFREVNGEWSEVQKLVSPMPNDQDAFGERVSISGTTTVVGARRNDDAANGAGAAYVFEYDGASWQFEQQLTASDAGIGDDFAISISIHDDIIVAGASGENGGGDNTGESIGAAYFFAEGATNVSSESLDAPNVWDLAVKAVYPNPSSGASTLPIYAEKPAQVEIDLFNVLGQRVREVYNGVLQPGNHNMAIKTDRLPAGMYYVQIRTADGSIAQIVNVLK